MYLFEIFLIVVDVNLQRCQHYLLIEVLLFLFLLPLLCTDLWGPSPVPTISGSILYHVSFIDDYSRYCWVYLISHQSELFHIYRITAILTPWPTPISPPKLKFFILIWAVNIFQDFISFLNASGTIRQFSCSSTP